MSATYFVVLKYPDGSEFPVYDNPNDEDEDICNSFDKALRIVEPWMNTHRDEKHGIAICQQTDKYSDSYRRWNFFYDNEKRIWSMECRYEVDLQTEVQHHKAVAMLNRLNLFTGIKH